MCVSAHFKDTVFLACFLNLVQKRFLQKHWKVLVDNRVQQYLPPFGGGAPWRKSLISSFNMIKQIFSYRKVHFKPILIF